MNYKKSRVAAYILLGGILTFGLYGIGKSAASGSNEYFQNGAYDHGSDDDSYDRRPTTKHPPLYQEECGSCHIAYPAVLLPGKSWQKLMAGLETILEKMQSSIIKADRL